MRTEPSLTVFGRPLAAHAWRSAVPDPAPGSGAGSIVVLDLWSGAQTTPPPLEQGRALVLSLDGGPTLAKHPWFALSVHAIVSLWEPRSVLAESLAAVMAGRRVITPGAAEAVLARMQMRHGSGAQPQPLSKREREVVTLLHRGLSTRQVARSLGLAVKTVEAHQQRLFSKLGVRTRAELLRVTVGHDD